MVEVPEKLPPAPDAFPRPDLHVLVNPPVVGLGVCSIALATFRYVAIRKAIIAGRESIPGDAINFLISFGLVAIGAGMMAYVLLRPL